LRSICCTFQNVVAINPFIFVFLSLSVVSNPSLLVQIQSSFQKNFRSALLYFVKCRAINHFIIFPFSAGIPLEVINYFFRFSRDQIQPRLKKVLWVVSCILKKAQQSIISYFFLSLPKFLLSVVNQTLPVWVLLKSIMDGAGNRIFFNRIFLKISSWFCRGENKWLN
jgi:hypothetical protein